MRFSRANDIHATYAPWSQSIDLYLFNIKMGQFGNGDVGPVDRRLLKCEFIEGELDPNRSAPPTLSLETDTAQRLMDQLWNCGIRPTEGSGSAGSLAATQRHLEDMRVIAFSQLKIPNENGPQVSKNSR